MTIEISPIVLKKPEGGLKNFPRSYIVQKVVEKCKLENSLKKEAEWLGYHLSGTYSEPENKKNSRDYRSTATKSLKKPIILRRSEPDEPIYS